MKEPTTGGCKPAAAATLFRASEGVVVLWCSPAEGDLGEISVRTIPCQRHAAEEKPSTRREGFSGVRSADVEWRRYISEVLYIAVIVVDYLYWPRRSNGGLEEAHRCWKSLGTAWSRWWVVAK